MRRGGFGRAMERKQRGSPEDRLSFPEAGRRRYVGTVPHSVSRLSRTDDIPRILADEMHGRASL